MSRKPTPQAERARRYREVFGGEDGERVLIDLLTVSGVLSSTFDPDPHIAAFNAGRAELALYILHQLNLKPKDLPDLYTKALEWTDEETRT